MTTINIRCKSTLFRINLTLILLLFLSSIAMPVVAASP